MTSTPAPSHGVLVVIEGCDGAGKSTIVPLVARELTMRGHKVQSFQPKQPDMRNISGYTKAHLERLCGLLWGETSSDEERNELPDLHWIMLSGSWFAAVDELMVRPALGEGGIVLLDSWYTKLEVRFTLKGPALADHARHAYSAATRAHTTVLLDVDPIVAASRKTTFGYSECGHFDGLRGRTRENFITYQRRVRAALVSRARTDGWSVIGTDAPPDDVARYTADAVDAALATFPGIGQ